ncbi:hypothetical protein H0X48_03445 [Candidatus Dependentiae bacterium]|nr:hypothetical protein [Candidatus Dependentiae bacterium]
MIIKNISRTLCIVSLFLTNRVGGVPPRYDAHVHAGKHEVVDTPLNSTTARSKQQGSQIKPTICKKRKSRKTLNENQSQAALASKELKKYKRELEIITSSLSQLATGILTQDQQAEKSSLEKRRLKVIQIIDNFEKKQGLKQTPPQLLTPNQSDTKQLVTLSAFTIGVALALAGSYDYFFVPVEKNPEFKLEDLVEFEEAEDLELV